MKSYERQKVKKKRITDGNNLYLFAGFLLIAFRIPLANLITDVGNGYLAGVWEFVNLLVVFLVCGLTRSAAVWIRKRGGKGQMRFAGKILTYVGFTGSISVFLAAAVVFTGANTLAEKLFGTRLSGIALTCGALLLLLVWWTELFRSYFEGTGNPAPNRLSVLIQSLGTVTGTFFLTGLFMEHGKKVGNLLLNPLFSYAFGAAGTVAGFLCGTVAALLFLIVIWLIHKGSLHHREKKETYRTPGDAGKAMGMIYRGIPAVLAEGSVLQCFHVVTVLLYCGIRISEENRTTAVELLGIYHGKFLVILSLLGFLLFVSVINGNELIKKIRELLHQEETRRARQLMGEGLRRSLTRGLPVSVSLLFLSELLVRFLYGGGDSTAQMLTYGSFTVFAMASALYLWKVMKELGMQRWMLFLQLAALLFHIVALLFLLNGQMASSKALALAEFFFWIVLLSGEIVIAFVKIRIPISWRRCIFDPLMGCAVMALLQVLCVKFLPSALPVLLRILITATGGIVIYALTVLMLRGSSKKQMFGTRAGRALYSIMKRFPFFS